MTPEQNPAICAELEYTARDIAAQSRRAPVHGYAEPRDIGDVPPRVIARLAGLVARHGYTVHRNGDFLDNLAAHHGKPPGAILGASSSVLDPDLPRCVYLHTCLSPASEARVLAHEAAHVMLGHTGISNDPELALTATGNGIMGDRDCESAVELAAGTFCRLARIGTGRASLQFIGAQMNGERVPEDVIQAGLLGARILWAAVKPALALVKAAA